MNGKHVQQRVTQYKENKKRVESGHSNHVPFYGFNRLQKYIPGIVPGIIYKITSHMGVGKTQLAKFLYVYQPMLYALKYKVNFKVLYFALEESREEFIDGLFIHLVKRLHGIQLDRFVMTGMSKNSLTKAELDAIENTRPTMERMMEHIEVIDYSYKPTDIYKICRRYAKYWGKFEVDDQGAETDEYIPNDPKQVVLVVADHISLLEREYESETKTYLSKMQSMAKWHTTYGKRIITKKWNWAMLNVQQQSLESEKQQFTMKGESIISKILPSLDGLANNKEVARDDYVVMGIFAPERYELEDYRGYPIVNKRNPSFGDRFRSLHLLKNRFGHPNKILPMYFDGRYNHFEEMCLPDDPNLKHYLNLLKT